MTHVNPASPRLTERLVNHPAVGGGIAAGAMGGKGRGPDFLTALAAAALPADGLPAEGPDQIGAKGGAALVDGLALPGSLPETAPDDRTPVPGEGLAGEGLAGRMLAMAHAPRPLRVPREAPLPAPATVALPDDLPAPDDVSAPVAGDASRVLPPAQSFSAMMATPAQPVQDGDASPPRAAARATGLITPAPLDAPHGVPHPVADAVPGRPAAQGPVDQPAEAPVAIGADAGVVSQPPLTVPVTPPKPAAVEAAGTVPDPDAATMPGAAVDVTSPVAVPDMAPVTAARAAMPEPSMASRPSSPSGLPSVLPPALSSAPVTGHPPAGTPRAAAAGQAVAAGDAAQHVPASVAGTAAPGAPAARPARAGTTGATTVDPGMATERGSDLQPATPADPSDMASTVPQARQAVAEKPGRAAPAREGAAEVQAPGQQGAAAQAAAALQPAPVAAPAAVFGPAPQRMPTMPGVQAPGRSDNALPQGAPLDRGAADPAMADRAVADRPMADRAAPDRAAPDRVAPDRVSPDRPTAAAPTPFAAIIAETTSAGAADRSTADMPRGADPVALPPVDLRTPEGVGATVDRILARLTEGGQAIEIALSPEHLGDLSIRMEMTDAGASVSITTATAEAAQTLGAAEPQLEAMLAQAGVTLADHAAAQGDRPAPAPGQGWAALNTATQNGPGAQGQGRDDGSPAGPWGQPGGPADPAGDRPDLPAGARAGLVNLIA